MERKTFYKAFLTLICLAFLSHLTYMFYTNSFDLFKLLPWIGLSFVIYITLKASEEIEKLKQGKLK